MKLLRIRASLSGPSATCYWSTLDSKAGATSGESPLAQLPSGVDGVELIVPAAQVLITRAQLPASRRRTSASLLAYAVEERIASDVELNQVIRLGAVGDEQVLAVVDRQGLTTWRDALAAVGIRDYAVRCETLLLPRQPQAWSLAWNGHEGFVRTGELEGSATDGGDRQTPPLALRLLLDEARQRQQAPAFITLHPLAIGAEPDLTAWQQSLAIDIRRAPEWDWRTAAPEASANLQPQRAVWRPAAETIGRLRSAGRIMLLALCIHSIGLVADWARLSTAQQDLRQQMESHFRQAFPDAVAVADPALQMRRKLAEARHLAGRPDAGDFPVMLDQVAAALSDLPPGALRVLSYEGDRITLELAAEQTAAAPRLVARLVQAGLRAELMPVRTRGTTSVVTLMVRPS